MMVMLQRDGDDTDDVDDHGTDKNSDGMMMIVGMMMMMIFY